jgi:hypothetical protein
LPAAYFSKAYSPGGAVAEDKGEGKKKRSNRKKIKEAASAASGDESAC